MTPASCNVYPVTTTLDPKLFNAKTVGMVKGAYATGTCTLAAALNANTAYAMMLVGTESTAGVYGPLGLTSWTYLASNGVMLD